MKTIDIFAMGTGDSGKAELASSYIPSLDVTHYNISISDIYNGSTIREANCDTFTQAVKVAADWHDEYNFEIEYY